MTAILFQGAPSEINTNMDVITAVSETSNLSAQAATPSPIIMKPTVTPTHQPHLTRYMPTPDLSGSQERRSSKRSIKRKRFDDEVVESSLLKQERTRDRKGWYKFHVLTRY